MDQPNNEPAWKKSGNWSLTGAWNHPKYLDIDIQGANKKARVDADMIKTIERLRRAGYQFYGGSREGLMFSTRPLVY